MESNETNQDKVNLTDVPNWSSKNEEIIAARKVNENKDIHADFNTLRYDTQRNEIPQEWEDFAVDTFEMSRDTTTTDLSILSAGSFKKNPAGNQYGDNQDRQKLQKVVTGILVLGVLNPFEQGDPFSIDLDTPGLTNFTGDTDLVQGFQRLLVNNPRDLPASMTQISQLSVQARATINGGSAALTTLANSLKTYGMTEPVANVVAESFQAILIAYDNLPDDFHADARTRPAEFCLKALSHSGSNIVGLQAFKDALDDGRTKFGKSLFNSFW